MSWVNFSSARYALYDCYSQEEEMKKENKSAVIQHQSVKGKMFYIKPMVQGEELPLQCFPDTFLSPVSFYLLSEAVFPLQKLHSWPSGGLAGSCHSFVFFIDFKKLWWWHDYLQKYYSPEGYNIHWILGFFKIGFKSVSFYLLPIVYPDKY